MFWQIVLRDAIQKNIPKLMKNQMSVLIGQIHGDFKVTA